MNESRFPGQSAGRLASAARVLILSLAVSAFAQGGTPAPRLERTDARDGKFSFAMPGKPEFQTKTLTAKNGHPVRYAAYTVDLGKSAYLVSTSDYDSETRIVLDGAIDGMLKTWEKPRIVERRRTTLYGYPAQLADFASGKYRVIVRVFGVGKRLYQLAFVERMDEYVPAHADAFMKSFRLR